MIYTIEKGKHRARPLRFGFWLNRSVWRWKVTFLPSCEYSLGSNDQLDLNKLAGFGFIPGHHTDSARFGWRWNEKTGLVELHAYCYVKGKRETRYICDVKIMEPIILTLQYIPGGSYLFYAGNNMVSVRNFHSKRISYRLGPFFGGNRSAPHKMNMEIKVV